MNVATIIQLIAVLLLSTIWALYLRKVDIFQPEKWYQVIIAMLFGGISTIPTILLNIPEIISPEKILILLSPFDHFLIENNILNSGLEKYIRDLEHFIWDVSFHEELYKIGCFFIFFLVFKPWFKEKPNYIIYASLVGLGFATVENFIYFQKGAGDSMYLRGMMSTFSHMANTAFIATMFGLGVHKKSVLKTVIYTLFGFLVSVMVHGIYNFFISLAMITFFIGAILIFTVQIEVWCRSMNNFLNLSSHYNSSKSLDRNAVQKYLFLVFFIAGLIQIAGLIYKYDLKTIANDFLFILVLEFILTIILVIRISRFTIIPNYWKPIRPLLPITIRKNKSLKNFIPLPNQFFLKVRGDEFNEYPFTSMIGKEVVLSAVEPYNNQHPLEIKVDIIDKTFLGTKKDLFYVGLLKELYTIDLEYNSRYVLLRPKSYGKKYEGKFPLVGLICLQGEINPKNIPIGNMKFIEWLRFRNPDNTTFTQSWKEILS